MQPGEMSIRDVVGLLAGFRDGRPLADLPLLVDVGKSRCEPMRLVIYLEQKSEGCVMSLKVSKRFLLTRYCLFDNKRSPPIPG